MANFAEISIFAGPGVLAPLPAVVIEALESVVVTAETKQASTFQITFRLDTDSPLHTIFLLGQNLSPIPLMRVVVMAKVDGKNTVLIDGVTIDHEVAPGPDPGTDLLTIRGEDMSAVLKLLTLTGIPYPAMPVYARVNLIIAKYLALGITPVVVPPIFEEIPLPTDRIPTHRCTDFDYLTLLAKEAGYVFYVDPGPAPGMSTAYFGPEYRIGVPQRSLNGNFDAHTNVESLSFKIDTDKATMPIIYVNEKKTGVPIPVPLPNISVLNPPLGAVPPIPKKINRLEGMGKMHIVRALAVGLAEVSESWDAVSGTGALDVSRYGRLLKARSLVGVRGVSPAFNGLYFVTAVTTTIQRGSIKQNFNLIRNGLISTLPRMAA